MPCWRLTTLLVLSTPCRACTATQEVRLGRETCACMACHGMQLGGAERAGPDRRAGIERYVALAFLPPAGFCQRALGLYGCVRWAVSWVFRCCWPALRYSSMEVMLVSTALHSCNMTEICCS